jgi:hypothetical protein
MSTLEAVLECLLPAEGSTPGATALALAPRVAAAIPDLEELLGGLEGFPDLTGEEQVAVLERLERSADPAFARLVAAAEEAYWADPRSWASVGYTTNLPGRP